MLPHTQVKAMASKVISAPLSRPSQFGRRTTWYNRTTPCWAWFGLGRRLYPWSCLRRLPRKFTLVWGPCRVIVYFLFAFLLEGCAGHLQTVDTSVQQTQLPFLVVGKTRMEEVLLNLGIPSAQFQGDRILTYRMRLGGKRKKGFVVVAREFTSAAPRTLEWQLAEYDLVLVFDNRHVLQKHSLIKLK